MASKTTPNWSQNIIKERKPPAVVFTRKNTTLEAWKAMVIEELVKLSVTNLTLDKLGALHAWELDGTPHSYAYILWQRQIRAEDKRRNPMG